MNLSRRALLSSSAAAAATAFFGGRVLADADSVVMAIEEFTGGGGTAYSELISFELPAIAENGNSVAMSVTVDSPCLLYTSPSPRDRQKSRMPSSA